MTARAYNPLPRWPLYVLTALAAGLLTLARMLAVSGDAALVEFGD